MTENIEHPEHYNKGKIEVSSESNVGTKFTIYLEVMDGKEDENTRRG